MQLEKVGVREFRENLTGYFEGRRPFAVTSNGATLGFNIPARKHNREAFPDEMRITAEEVDAMIASWGATEDELMDELQTNPGRGSREESECRVERRCSTRIS